MITLKTKKFNVKIKEYEENIKTINIFNIIVVKVLEVIYNIDTEQLLLPIDHKRL